MASASKDETVIVWDFARLMPSVVSKAGGYVDHQDYIVTIIDDHEHVIDCIKFAPESCCRTIQTANYTKSGAGANMSGDMDSTVETTPEDGEESKTDMTHDDDDSRMVADKRQNIKDKVKSLKERLQ